MKWTSLAALLLVAHAAPLSAQGDDPAADFARASTALIERLGTIESERAAVGIADAATRADLATIDAAMGQFGSAAFPVDGLNSFDDVCGRLNALNVRYALDGLVAYRRAGGSVDGPAMLRFGGRNVARFQDETALLTDRLVQCQAQHIPALVAMVASLPADQLTETRRSGLRSLRQGNAGTILGVMINARDSTIRAANRARLLASVVRWTGPLARQMTVESRQTLRRQIGALRPALTGEALAQQNAVLAVLSDTGCVEMCLIN